MPHFNPTFGNPKQLSIVLPARNEAAGLSTFLPRLRARYPHADILVVNDGSDDNTAHIAQQAGARVVHHPYSMGNGAAIKTGARHAQGDVLVFMDADGQHNVDDIAKLLQQLNAGFDMAVGARDDASQASWLRRQGNHSYNRLASWITNHKIEDLTSGFRAVRAHKFREFLHLLPNGFSYPTTSTMAFFRAGYSVAYVPIKAARRIGTSHINLSRDGARFFLIIFKVGTLYSPLKVFLPISAFFFCTAMLYYLIGLGLWWPYPRFTNMGALLFVSSILVFLIGLVSEQITMLIYRDPNQTTAQPQTDFAATIAPKRVDQTSITQLAPLPSNHAESQAKQPHESTH